MALVTGSYLIARTLKEEGVDTLFYLMGGANFDIVMACEDMGIKAVDFRHEQAAAFAAHARVTGKPGVCTAASGPGTLNLLTGVYTAAIDCAPMVVLGGAGPVHEIGREAFQEVEILRRIDRHAPEVVCLTETDVGLLSKPESTKGGRQVSVLKWQEGAPVLLG